jgi:hypothetical protein
LVNGIIAASIYDKEIVLVPVLEDSCAVHYARTRWFTSELGHFLDLNAKLVLCMSKVLHGRAIQDYFILFITRRNDPQVVANIPFLINSSKHVISLGHVEVH